MFAPDAPEALGKIVANKLPTCSSLSNYCIKGITDALVKLLPAASEPLPTEDVKLLTSLTLTALLNSTPAFDGRSYNRAALIYSTLGYYMGKPPTRLREFAKA